MSGLLSRPRRSVASRRATFGALALVVAGTVGTLGACKKGDNDARAENAPVPVTVGKENITVVRLDTVRSGPAISGSLEAERQATIRAEVTAPVVQTYVEAGQRVSQGTLLARIDETSIRDAYLSARSAVTSAQTALDVAQRQYARQQALLSAGAIAERDIEQARSAFVGAQAQLADAQSRLAAARKSLSDTQIRAPFAGVVAQRQVSAGDNVSPGTALFTIVEPSTMRLEASVPAEQLSAVRVGAPVTFTVSGYGDRNFTGKITRVSPVADPTTRQVQILASIPNAGSALVGGLFADGRVASESRTAPTLPLSAVDQRGVAPAVMRIKGGRVDRVQVELGLQDAATETVEIRAGVTPGDTVLLGAAQGISPGTVVRVSDVADTTRTAAK